MIGARNTAEIEDTAKEHMFFVRMQPVEPMVSIKGYETWISELG
jgi:hypothetical protein